MKEALTAIGQRTVAEGCQQSGFDLPPQVVRLYANGDRDLQRHDLGGGHTRLVPHPPQPLQVALDEPQPTRCDVRDLVVQVRGAGIVDLAPAEELSLSAWQRTLDINLTGSFLVAQAVGRLMIARGSGRIINMASQAGTVAIYEHVAYCASKFGVIGLTKTLAAEWGKHGVTVNSISPTVVLTELGKTAWAGEKGEAAIKQIPSGRFAEPVEIAAARKSARQACEGRVIAVHQPHRYTRLSSLFDDFCACFNDADVVGIAEVYAAGEDPIEGASRDDLVAGLIRHGHRHARAVVGEDDLERLVREQARPGDMVVCLGAGTISTWANGLPARLQKGAA